MAYDWLGNLIAALHAAVIALDCIGAGAVLRGSLAGDRLKLWHRAYLLLVGTKSASFLLFNQCPLTVVERSVRETGASGSSYDGSFVQHYVPLLPPSADEVATVVFMFIGLIGVLQAAGCRARNQVASASGHFHSTAGARP